MKKPFHKCAAVAAVLMLALALSACTGGNKAVEIPEETLKPIENSELVGCWRLLFISSEESANTNITLEMDRTTGELVENTELKNLFESLSVPLEIEAYLFVNADGTAKIDYGTITEGNTVEWASKSYKCKEVDFGGGDDGILLTDENNNKLGLVMFDQENKNYFMTKNVINEGIANRVTFFQKQDSDTKVDYSSSKYVGKWKFNKAVYRGFTVRNGIDMRLNFKPNGRVDFLVEADGTKETAVLFWKETESGLQFYDDDTVEIKLTANEENLTFEYSGVTFTMERE